jgi:hypothetical protein
MHKLKDPKGKEEEEEEMVRFKNDKHSFQQSGITF